MIRKFNYTGRKKIRRSRVRIDLLRDGQGERYFNISLDLADANLPSDARVFVEAYHRSGYQRYDFGTVGRRETPAQRGLDRFSDSALPLFRVKVVGRTAAHGRILASVDKLRPETVDEVPVGSQSLLFVEYEDLGGLVWQLDLDGDWPVLRLNSRIEEVSQIAASDPRFQSLVYPETLRQILHRILIEEQHTDPDCDDDWPSLWLKLASTLPGMTLPPAASRSAQAAWIEKAVDAFCGCFEVIEKFSGSF